jgi:Protein of unknown function (DUF2877)
VSGPVSSVTLPVHAIATPVLERLSDGPCTGRVAGRVPQATYIELDDFVVALTAPGVPLMPNCVALAVPPPAWPPPGAEISCREGGMVVRGRPAVHWDLGCPPEWDPAPNHPPAAGTLAVARRGRRLLTACGVAPALDSAFLGAALDEAGLFPHEAGGPHPTQDKPLGLLLEAVVRADRTRATHAAHALVGRGAGLTPVGDDLLAGTAATVAILAEAAGWAPATRDGWLMALRRSATGRQTTRLSAALLELATRGRVVEPVHTLVDLTPEGDRRWRFGLRRLLQFGHSTGRAYALAIGATALLLGDPRPQLGPSPQVMGKPKRP